MNLNDTSAVITGGASGLGAATARKLAASGVRVVIADLHEEQGEAIASELNGAFVLTDVRNSEQVQTAVDAAVEMGPFRSLVNCAGVGNPSRMVNRDGEPVGLDFWEFVVGINLTGTFNCMRLSAAAMANNDPDPDSGDRGAIVNTASVAAYDGQVGQTAYAASKAGIVGLALPAARDLSSISVRVNTIAPGIMDTPMLAGLPEPARESLSQQVLYPKRLGRPEEYADTAHFLLSQSYMNAESIRLDGGIRMAPK